MNLFPEVVASSLPWITTDEMREVDRVMIEDLRIDLTRMMEGAGRTLARTAEVLFEPKRVVVLAGPGGNGGGALVAARHLHNHGVKVQVVLSRDPAEMTPVPLEQWRICERLGIEPVTSISTSTDTIIDGLIGYSLKGNPRGRTAELIEEANAHDAAVLSLDTPSGLDTTCGAVGTPCIRAAATMTLAAPKQGLRNRGHDTPVGSLLLADISVPPSVYEPFGKGSGPIFDRGPILSVSRDLIE